MFDFLRKKKDTVSGMEASTSNKSLLRAFLSVGMVFVIAGVTAGAGTIMFHKAWQEVKEMDDFKVDPSTLELRGLPEWVSPEIAEEICKGTSLQGPVSIFAPHVAERIAQDFARSPWIASIKSIKKEFPNRISMQFDLRRPLAIVRSHGKSYMLDAEGVVLSPSLYKWPTDMPMVPPIVPAPSVQIPAPGRRCEDPGVQAGIDVLIFLLQNRVDKIIQISAIDVTNAGGRLSKTEPEIVLWASATSSAPNVVAEGKRLKDEQVRIKWGRPPSQTDTGEVTPHEKLANLVAVLANEGRHFPELDYADIRWDKAYVKYK